jgi:hypothetical protein
MGGQGNRADVRALPVIAPARRARRARRARPVACLAALLAGALAVLGAADEVEGRACREHQDGARNDQHDERRAQAAATIASRLAVMP